MSDISQLHSRYEYMKQWRNKNIDHVRKKDAERRTSDGYKQYQKQWLARNREKVRAYQREEEYRLRNEVISAYGGKCSCCGEHEFKFLSLDHIENDGANERKELGSNRAVYRKVRRLGYPKDRYQVLCFNCNCARGLYGECPHKRVTQP